MAKSCVLHPHCNHVLGRHFKNELQWKISACLVQSWLVRRDIAPFLDHRFLNLPGIGSWAGTYLFGNINALFDGFEQRHQFGYVFARFLGFQITSFFGHLEFANLQLWNNCKSAFTIFFFFIWDWVCECVQSRLGIFPYIMLLEVDLHCRNAVENCQKLQ